MVEDFDYVTVKCALCESSDALISPPEPFICFECENKLELSRQSYLEDKSITMQELTFIRVRKEVKPLLCPDCSEIKLECTDNHFVYIDIDFLEHMQQNCDPDDPMHEFYKGIDPENLPEERCPDCQKLTEAEGLLEEI